MPNQGEARTTPTPPAILLTGRPGVGKTTAGQKIVASLGNRAGGFYTREVRSGRRRRKKARG